MRDPVSDDQFAALAEQTNPSMAQTLALDRIDETTFRRIARTTPTRRMFGGEAFAIAVLAAERAIGPERALTGAQAHFLLPGSTREDITAEVAPVREGRSFSVRHVDLVQAGGTILTLLASGQTPERGLSHQLEPGPEVPAPETLPSPEELLHDDPPNLSWIRSLLSRHPIECRFVDRPLRALATRGASGEARQRTWVRTVGARRDDPASGRAAVAYVSDLFLLATSVAPYGRTIQDADLQFATLDHSVWFHAQADADDWLLYDQRALWNGGGRTLCQGALYTRAGELVATVVQQALIRVHS